ncbi:DUF3892 domain-containing protein [Alteriqipengyuania sp.]|uniref:DUF3892 domain-containing protein n=1 Tax=Alteriqipengyuania sp. TaxID=2800692 RepID=UPI00351692D6
MDYRITATRKDGPDPDYRIDAFKVNGTWYTIGQMIGFIRDGYRFTVEAAGRIVNVVLKQHPRTLRWYLTTEADGFPPNNLLALPND